MTELHPPIGLLAELTHRCPLKCGYCSNPTELLRRERELSTAQWLGVLEQAEALGLLQVHLSGGEPAARADPEAIVGCCARLGLYSNLITSGVQIDARRLSQLCDAGLDHVQLSLQHVDPGAADAIAGFRGAHARKLAFAWEAVRLGLPLTVNAVVHRLNIEAIPSLVALAAELGAGRVEIAHVQYHGWAWRNRAALLPSRAQAIEAAEVTAALQERYRGRLVIDTVPCDYHARVPKPCHAAETIPGLGFWTVRDHTPADIWANSPAFTAYRGLDWMVEPCVSCAASAPPSRARRPLFHALRDA